MYLTTQLQKIRTKIDRVKRKKRKIYNHIDFNTAPSANDITKYFKIKKQRNFILYKLYLKFHFLNLKDNSKFQQLRP